MYLFSFVLKNIGDFALIPNIFLYFCIESVKYDDR